ncbi:MAG: hypothetical protein GX100_07520 [candidate division WS1 bacterium]|nr:hypothetical protein [candidate division WS1 bacterium]
MSSDAWVSDWQHDWDPEVGLWWSEQRGHTVPVRSLYRVHIGREAAGKLVQAAQLGQLDQVPVRQVLEALRAMQVTEPGEFEGCFRWYWEEPGPVDTNAAFFISLPLLALRLGFPEALAKEDRQMLDEMFVSARTWFTQAVAHRTFYYPNKFLGDLVCAWLLLEVTGAEDPGGLVERTLLEAATYWRENGWGWGEHLSDGYSRVCFQELSMLLLFSRRLPPQVREAYQGLLGDLLAIEDAFGDGPRVPALRSYAFVNSPEHQNYRDRVRPLAEGEAPELEHLFAAHGWHDLASPRQAPAVDTDFLCWGGVHATGHCEPDARLGGMSRYPLMLSAEHTTWGLCWQSFPVCFWRPAGDWGFLQWEVLAEGRVGCHPARQSLVSSYGDVALAHGMEPPIFGRTWTLQRGGNLVALRVLPAVMQNWDHVADRLRIVDCQAETNARSLEKNCQALDLKYPERTLGVACLPLTEGTESLLRTPEGEPLDWEFRWEREPLTERECVVLLWGLTLEGPICEAPVLVPNPEAPVLPRPHGMQAWQITWRWPAVEWHLRLDPLAEEPLQLVEEPEER